MMDRRNFITSTAAVGAMGLVGTVGADTAKAAKAAADVHTDLTGVWVDPFLQEPDAIIIESNGSGSDVRVTGTYWQDDAGQCCFHGKGSLKGDELTIKYDHPNVDSLGKGTAKMKLSKMGNTDVLKGQIQKSDGSWVADNVTWYKQRR